MKSLLVHIKPRGKASGSSHGGVFPFQASREKREISPTSTTRLITLRPTNMSDEDLSKFFQDFEEQYTFHNTPLSTLNNPTNIENEYLNQDALHGFQGASYQEPPLTSKDKRELQEKIEEQGNRTDEISNG